MRKAGPVQARWATNAQCVSQRRGLKAPVTDITWKASGAIAVQGGVRALGGFFGAACSSSKVRLASGRIDQVANPILHTPYHTGTNNCCTQDAELRRLFWLPVH
jgi:hypothetical protein